MLIIFVRSAASFSCPLFSLLSDIGFWIQVCKREIRKYPLKDLLCHKLSSTYSLFLHHLKLHSDMLSIPRRKMLTNAIALRLFLIYNLLNSTSHTGLNWQHLKSQVFCPLSTSHFSLYTDSCVLPRGAWFEWPRGLKEEMALIHSFGFQLEAFAGLKFPSTLKSDITIK